MDCNRNSGSIGKVYYGTQGNIYKGKIGIVGNIYILAWVSGKLCNKCMDIRHIRNSIYIFQHDNKGNIYMDNLYM